jgi:hypothetical protein
MTLLIPTDELFHDAGDDPMWNESAWFSFMIPERNLIGGIHWNHRPNMNLCWQKVVIWDGRDGRGEETYDCFYFDAFELQPLSLAHATGNFDFSTAMGLTCRTLEPWKRYSLRYERNDCVLDLEWEAFMEAFSTPFLSEGKGWGVNNYQQGGRIRGTLNMDGALLAIDSPSNRDRSWGPRSFHHGWNSFPRHQWPWFNDGTGFAGNLYTAANFLSEDAPSAPPGQEPQTPKAHFGPERVVNGWLFQEGKAGRVVDGGYEVLERRSDGLPMLVSMFGRDEHDRSFSARGEALNFLRRASPPGLVALPSLIRWTFDSGRTVYGQTTELYPQELARRFFRSIC